MFSNAQIYAGRGHKIESIEWRLDNTKHMGRQAFKKMINYDESRALL